ncbi:MAG: CotH kinase family protein [Oscillospiraceae bacterium]|nr:CotH kinase family protein [Oscillospiraceae bacterium]
MKFIKRLESLSYRKARKYLRVATTVCATLLLLTVILLIGHESGFYELPPATGGTGASYEVHGGTAEQSSPTANPEDAATPEPPAPELPKPPAFKERGAVFSHESGFYSEAFELELSPICGRSAAAVYYTTDGTNPVTSSTRKRYIEPIKVAAPEPFSSHRVRGELVSGTNALTISAVTVFEGETTEPSTRSFICGTDVHERFMTDALVFTLYTDPHGLYNSVNGIFAGGIELRGMRSERPAHVEMFAYNDEAGQWFREISQRIGIRVRGEGSRLSIPIKSIELMARRDYGDAHNLTYDFFSGRERAENGEIIDRYRRLRLRNSSDDRNFAMLRDELSQEVFRLAGHPDTQSHTPAVLFLNGEYYGMKWLKTPRTVNHWQRRYGGISENYEIIGNSEYARQGPPRAADDWAAIRALAGRGLTNEDRWQEFTARVCIDNLIRYYATQVFINNEDWPNNNIQLWRYFPSVDELEDEIEYNSLHPFLQDGRWRFIAQDVETAWGMYGNPFNDDKSRINTIANLIGRGSRPGGTSPLLRAVLERDDMRVKFANTLLELMEEGGALHPDSTLAILESLIERSQHEAAITFRYDLIRPGASWPAVTLREIEYGYIRHFATNRPDRVRDHIESALMRNRRGIEFDEASGRYRLAER